MKSTVNAKAFTDTGPVSGPPERFVPSSQREHYTVDRKRYLKELDYLKQCSGPKGSTVALFREGVLSINRPDAHYQARIGVDGECQIAYGVDINYMMDALNQFSGADYVDIHISGHLAPITVTAGGTGDIALVMPARVREAA